MEPKLEFYVGKRCIEEREASFAGAPIPTIGDEVFLVDESAPEQGRSLWRVVGRRFQMWAPGSTKMTIQMVVESVGPGAVDA